MDNLPFELLPMIFRYLYIEDLSRCRCVSKKFKFYVEKIKINDLLIIDRKLDDDEPHWYFVNAPKQSSNTIRIESFLRCSKAFNLKSELKRLYINDQRVIFFDLSLLNGFTKLEQLEFGNTKLSYQNLTLNLPNLNILKVYPYTFGCNLYLETPKLEILKCRNLDSIRVQFPQALKHLDIEHYDSKVQSFVNLTYLQCDFEAINSDILSVLEHLNELHLTDRLFPLNEFEYAILQTLIGHLFRQMQQLERTNFGVFLQGVRLVNGREPFEYDLSKRNLKFQVDKSDLICADYRFHSDEVNYSELTAVVRTIPDAFFQTFFNVRKVTTTRTLVNLDHFVRFLTSLRKLSELNLNESSLPQKFYNSLPDVCRLECLRISEDDDLAINFNFVLKMRRLKHFETNQQFSNAFNLAVKLFTRSDKIEYFQFRSEQDHVSVQKNKTNDYDLETFHEIKGNTLNVKITKYSVFQISLIQLETYCDHLQSRNKIVTRNRAKIARTIEFN